MKLTGNTIFITGGGSGIGRALAAEFHRRGNTVIIAGRRKERLEATVKEFPGMHYVTLDATNPDDIKKAAKEVIGKFPEVNVLVNNAGIMDFDDASTEMDDEKIVATVTTNLIGPIRLTSAFIEHFKKQETAYVLNLSSVLAFVPLAASSTYCATKAAIHSYSLSLRYKLRDTAVKVLEVMPPWVQTDLINSNEEPRAMPLKSFIEQTMAELATEANEILVAKARPLRENVGVQDEQNTRYVNDLFMSNDPSLSFGELATV